MTQQCLIIFRRKAGVKARTSRLAWRSLSFSARTRCCSALSARRFSCETSQDPGKTETKIQGIFAFISGCDSLTILSFRAMSSSSSFFLHSKWASIRACSSIRSLFWRFFWMSCRGRYSSAVIDEFLVHWAMCGEICVCLHQSPPFHHPGSLERWVCRRQSCHLRITLHTFLKSVRGPQKAVSLLTDSRVKSVPGIHQTGG